MKPSFSFLKLFSYPYGFIFKIKPFGSKHEEINSIFKIFDFLDTSLIFDKLSKLWFSTFSKASDRFSLSSLIFANLNLFNSSKFSSSVSILIFLFFSVVISLTDNLSWFGSQHYSL